MTLSYLEAKTASDVDGNKIRVGDMIRAIDPRDGQPTGPEVRVVKLHRQGYDGTIVTTDPAPEPTFPHHFSRAAKYCRKVTTGIEDRGGAHRRLLQDARTLATQRGHDLKPFEIDKRISTLRTDYEGTSFCRRCGAVALTSTIHADPLRGDALSAHCRKVSR